MSATDDPRSRILAATVACIGSSGLARTTVEDVAAEAGLARATVYRHFAGGREQLIGEAITWEVGRFLTRLEARVADAPDFPSHLERWLLSAHRAIEDHAVLQKVIETEPQRLLPQLTVTGPLIVAVLRGYFAPLLAAERLRPGLDPDEAADWLARNVLSFIVAEGSWDLSDAGAVHALVRTQLLAGVLDPVESWR